MTLTDPWRQSPDRSTWVASSHGALLSVTRLSLDSWAPRVQWPSGETAASPNLRTRAAAQRWCERRAGEGNG